jgi:hypothetical protein
LPNIGDAEALGRLGGLPYFDRIYYFCDFRVTLAIFGAHWSV